MKPGETVTKTQKLTTVHKPNRKDINLTASLCKWVKMKSVSVCVGVKFS